MRSTDAAIRVWTLTVTATEIDEVVWWGCDRREEGKRGGGEHAGEVAQGMMSCVESETDWGTYRYEGK